MIGFFDRIRSILASREKLAIVTVIDSSPPSSIKPGHRLIVRESGEIEGWSGGWCTSEAIVSKALKAIREGAPLLDDLETCSGGRARVLIDPIYPPPKIVAIGSNRIVWALQRFSDTLGYEFEAIEPESIDKISMNGRVDDNTYIVIATLGSKDHIYAEKLINTKARYIGIVANRKRFQTILRYLEDRGVDEEKIKKLKAPAGIDIAAKTPEEIALSIAAEIVKMIRIEAKPEAAKAGEEEKREMILRIELPSQTTQAVAIDPVCGMIVEPEKTPYKTRYRDQEIYFCSIICLEKFREDPEKYISKLMHMGNS